MMYVASLAILTACGGEAVNEKLNEGINDAIEQVAEDVMEDAKLDFGPVEVNPELAMSVSEMLESNGTDTTENEFTFKGEITQVCSKAGCWVNIKSGEEEFMVRFKDHFTIPTDTEPGTMAVLHGVGKMTEIPVADLQHFAEDAGESQEEIDAITEPEYDFAFTADGIKLMK